MNINVLCVEVRQKIKNNLNVVVFSSLTGQTVAPLDGSNFTTAKIHESSLLLSSSKIDETFSQSYPTPFAIATANR